MPQVPATLDWLFAAIAIVLAIGALVVFVRALFRDRARGRFRCPKCWYDLTAVDKTPPALPVTCSECGRVTSTAKRLHKTRRRWGRALVCALMLPVAFGVASFPAVQRSGWTSLVPLWFLVETMPTFGYPTKLTTILEKRLRAMSVLANPPATGPTADREYADINYVARRFAEGRPGATPFSDAWVRSYGAFLQQSGNALQTPMQTRTPELAKALDPLMSLTPQVEIRTRDRWPAGVPLWVRTEFQVWYPGAWIGIDSKQTNRTALHGVVVLEHPTGSDGEVSADLVVRWGGDRQDRGRKEAIRATAPYHIGGSIDDLITPVVDPALDQYIASIVTAYQGRIQIETWTSSAPISTPVAFGVIVEYLKEGVVVARERRWWRFQFGPVRFGKMEFGNEFLPEPDNGASRLYAVHKSGERWAVRIVSDPETALRVFNATEYWQGDVTVDITIP